MRLLLVIVFAAGLMASSSAKTGSDGRRDDSASKSVLLGEAADEALYDPLIQALPVSFVSALAQAGADAKPASRLDSRQTNRHRLRSDLYRLKRVFLI